MFFKKNNKKKKRKSRPDRVLLFSVFLFMFLGFIILVEASVGISQKLTGSPWYFLVHQIIFGYLPGGILGFLAYKMNPLTFKKIALWLLIPILLMMILVFIPKIGNMAGGARRWVSLGGIRFQPSEFLKLTFIIYLSAWLSSRKGKKRQSPQVFWPLIFILSIICALLMSQPDMSTLVVIAIVAIGMYFCAKPPIKHFLALILAGASAGVIFILTSHYRLSRIITFLEPNNQPLGSGYQIRQSLISIGSGHITGQGFGLGIQKSNFLPQPMTDSIFAVFTEEAGFIGAIVLLSIFLIFVWQGLRVAKKSSNPFLSLMAIGLILWFSAQTIINIGAISGVLPLTGIPLPFISYGSSHLVAELIGLGILLNISKHNQEFA